MRLARFRFKIRSTRTSKKLRPRKLRIRLGKKRKKNRTKEDKTDKKVKMIILTQLEFISLKLQRAQKKSDIMASILQKTFLKLLAITVIKNTISREIAI